MLASKQIVPLVIYRARSGESMEPTLVRCRAAIYSQMAAMGNHDCRLTPFGLGRSESGNVMAVRLLGAEEGRCKTEASGESGNDIGMRSCEGEAGTL